MSKQYHTDAELAAAVKQALPEVSSVLTNIPQAALTAQLTTITHHAPTTPDYAIQDLTTTTPYGFATQDEGESVLKVIANLQTRLADLEAKLQAAGILS